MAVRGEDRRVAVPSGPRLSQGCNLVRRLPRFRSVKYKFTALTAGGALCLATASAVIAPGWPLSVSPGHVVFRVVGWEAARGRELVARGQALRGLGRRAAALEAAARRLARDELAQERAAQRLTARPRSLSPQQIAQGMLAADGMTGQFSCLDSLWMRESRWSVTAENPSSGTYGIPQALPGSEMASAGPDWRTDPVTQIRWGLSYIRGRYGSPCAAWAHEQADGWY